MLRKWLDPVETKPLYFFSAIIVIYLITRFFNLELIPIFNDESTYIRYGMHEYNEPVFKAYSLLIGKEPLLPYLFAVFGTAVNNLLLGSRIVSIIFGLFTLVGLILFTKEALNRKVAALVAVLYVLSPFNLFFDRLALLDSAINTVAIWSLYLTYLILKNPKWVLGAALGFIVGIGLYIKTSAFFYLFLPVAAIALTFIPKFEISKDKKMLTQVIGFSFLVSLLLFVPLFQSEYYVIHLELLNQYTYPLSSVFSFPVANWIANFSNLSVWVIFYLTPFLFSAAVIGFFYLVKKPKYFPIILWFILPLTYEVLYAKLFTSRHVLLLTVPLLIASGWGIYNLYLKNRAITYFLILGIFIGTIFSNYLIWFTPEKASSFLPRQVRGDIGQYFKGFSSGYGVVEAIDYVKKQSEKGNTNVVIRNDHGNPEDAVVGYLGYEPNIQLLLISDVESFEKIISQKVLNEPMYYVSRGAYYGGMEKYLTEEKKFSKPNDSEFVGVYKIKLK
ncbi:MAG: hypothetical protein ACD_37C00398G0002 [uncultured bacterium]|nr:MAG: hypothetical protein ACD_37C00398G0002 [uncultured bacterium]